MIKVRNLYKSFDKQMVLKGVNLDVPSSATTVIIGGSGQGKSVLLKHVIGLLQPDRGSIVVDDIELVGLGIQSLNELRKSFGMLFQDAALFDSMTVFDNVAFPLHEQQRLDDGEIKERVNQALDHVNLQGAAEKATGELSGGMRKRVGLARAIVHQPKYILYDEPTTGLDPVTSNQINWLINDTRDRFGITSLVISHDLSSTKAIANQIAMLYDGQIVEAGIASEMLCSDNPIVTSFLRGEIYDPNFK